MPQMDVARAAITPRAARAWSMAGHPACVFSTNVLPARDHAGPVRSVRSGSTGPVSRIERRVVPGLFRMAWIDPARSLLGPLGRHPGGIGSPGHAARSELLALDV